MAGEGEGLMEKGQQFISPVVVSLAATALLIGLGFIVLNPTSLKAPTAAVSATPTIAGTLNYSMVDNGSLGSLTDMQTMAITSQAQWDQVKNNFNLDKLTNIDLSKQDLVLLVYGGKTTGYQPAIKSIASDGNRIVVGYTREAPGQGCLTGQAITMSYQLLSVQKTNQPYTFEAEQVETSPCSQ